MTAGSGRARVPIEELIDPDVLARLRRDGRMPPPRELRAALPRGWALDADGRHAHRDARLLFREGWILLLGLAIFGTLGAFFLVDAVPRGWRGALRLALLVGLVLLAGGVVGPLVTRAVHRRR
jgi:hypothetical protein